MRSGLLARHTGHRLGAGLVTRRPTSGWATLLVAERSLRPARIARDSLVLRATSGRVGRPERFWLLFLCDARCGFDRVRRSSAR